MEPILDVKNLKQHFKVNRNFTVKAVDGIDFYIAPGETYGLVGESGSGKSTTGRSIIRLYDPTDGTITFCGRTISGKLSKEDRKFLHTNMQMIFQDPMACLNPREKVMDIVAEGLDIHHLYSSQEERAKKVYDMLELVGLSKEHANRYPHQFSGGQRQRIGIARALVMDPKLIIADEAISALDVSIQAQVVNLMKKIQKQTNTAFLFIAHDLSMVKYISDRIGVMHLGHLVETGTTEEIFKIRSIHIRDPFYRRSQNLIQSLKKSAALFHMIMKQAESTTPKDPTTMLTVPILFWRLTKNLKTGPHKQEKAPRRCFFYIRRYVFKKR